MAEIMLALGKDSIKPLRDLGSTLINSVYGVKILTNEQYSFRASDDEHRRRGYPAVSKLIRIFGAKKIMVDARIANDTTSEVADAVSTIVTEVTNPHVTANYSSHKQKAPDYITAGVDITHKATEVFIENCIRLGVEPVMHLTSSRFSQVDFENRSTTSEKNAVWKTKLAMNSGFTTGVVICAAADAEVIKNQNPNFVTFATGAILADSYDTDPYELRHERPALIEEVAEFVDIFILGSPIFMSNSPSDALKNRIEAAKS